MARVTAASSAPTFTVTGATILNTDVAGFPSSATGLVSPKPVPRAVTVSPGCAGVEALMIAVSVVNRPILPAPVYTPGERGATGTVTVAELSGWPPTTRLTTMAAV